MSLPAFTELGVPILLITKSGNGCEAVTVTVELLLPAVLSGVPTAMTWKVSAIEVPLLNGLSTFTTRINVADAPAGKSPIVAATVFVCPCALGLFGSLVQPAVFEA